MPTTTRFATYRGHAHTLARGVPMTPVLAELLGRANGLMGGKGGSMHLTSVEHGMMGSYAIIGAHLTIANGAAWSAQYRGSGQVAVCFFGDGTTNIGAFHEALNYAAVYRLPVVFVCENNLYMEYTSIADITAVRAPGRATVPRRTGLSSIVIDGNDADEVYLTATDVLARARRGDGPSLVEAVTYRHGGHSRADPGKYRPESEVDAWKAYDPITVYRGPAAAPRRRREPSWIASTRRLPPRSTGQPRRRSPASCPHRRARSPIVWADGGSSWRN